MSLGVIILAHKALYRVVQVANHWAEQGCPVVIHVDAKSHDVEFADLKSALTNVPNVHVLPRKRLTWGRFNIVSVTLQAADHLLKTYPDVERVILTSGSCLPMRPVLDLKAYLAGFPDTDFIESVNIRDVPWAKTGLEEERFSLWFPFAWKSQRWLFDSFVELQRWLGVRRRMPAGLSPYSGSQWWCLTRETLQKILTNPHRRAHERFFKFVWIPDESYFQTLGRKFARKIESRSLTLSKFDHKGRPHVFYDDHLKLLKESGCFVVRKVWSGADKLYDEILKGSKRSVPSNAAPEHSGINTLISRATAKRSFGRPGLLMQGRYPSDVALRAVSAHRYMVFEGFEHLYKGFAGWLQQNTELVVHGHLFSPQGAEFERGATAYYGGLSAAPLLRDYDAPAFLQNLIRNGSPRKQAFMFGPEDFQGISWDIALDPNAHISVISGAWAVPFWQQGLQPEAIYRRAAKLQRTERAHLEILRSPYTRAKIQIWSLTEFLTDPHNAHKMAIGSMKDQLTPDLAPAEMVDLDGFDKYIQSIRNHGINLCVVGDISARLIAGSQTNRDYLNR